MKWLVYFSMCVVAASIGVMVSAAMYKAGVAAGEAHVMTEINSVVAEECRKAGL